MYENPKRDEARLRELDGALASPELLQPARLAAGITLKDLEAESGWSENGIWKAERRNNCAFIMLRDLFNALGFELVLRRKQENRHE